MTLADIKALPVANIAARDSALFLWVIDTHLEQALELGRAWGFAYKTVGFVWAKTTQTGSWDFSLGYWTRKGAEVCLMFTRGKPQRLSASVRQLIVAARREHSRKPDEAYGAIEALLPGPYVELFARHQRPGWVVWGDQAPKENPASGEARAGLQRPVASRYGDERIIA